MGSAGLMTRADARRNREAVVDAAIALLSEDPGASMQQIADASGLGRTTVYRHFPSREGLVESIFHRVIAEALDASRRIIERGGSAEEILGRLAVEFVALGRRFRFLQAHRAAAAEILQHSMELPEDPVRGWLERAQAAGELRSDLPLHWMQSTMQALAIASTDEVNSGLLSPERAGELLGQTLALILLPR